MGSRTARAASSSTTTTMIFERAPRVLNNRYHLHLQLGAGGQASVWLGEDDLLKRRVAIKQLVPQDGGEDIVAVRQRALREARAMALVRHRAIVPIHDILFTGGDADTGDPWLVMEFVDGSTLQSLIDDGPLDDATIARIGLGVLDGLMAVHRADIVHRDVKPDNILIAGEPHSDDAAVFLVDFGIAKINGDRPVTRTDRIVGTPAYIAPERLRNGPVTAAADLWSLGVTLYRAVDGASPFQREGEYQADATRAAILHDQPRPPRRESALTGIIIRMLVKEPDRRADAEEVRVALSAIVRRAARDVGPTVPDPAQADVGPGLAPGASPRTHPADTPPPPRTPRRPPQRPDGGRLGSAAPAARRAGRPGSQPRPRMRSSRRPQPHPEGRDRRGCSDAAVDPRRGRGRHPGRLPGTGGR